MRRVVDLPGSGRLLVATDLQGNVRDFERVAAVFEEAQASEGDAYLVLTGDLVHGPELLPEQWPEQLGTYYHGDSTLLLEMAEDLQRRHPARVIYLLGNHEHAHVGGPVVGKFFSDEAARLEELMGESRAAEVRAWFETWPLVAVAKRAQICLLHAAPHAPVRSRADVEAVELDDLQRVALDEAPTRSVLGSLLWARSTSDVRARAFLQAMEPGLRVAVYGHDVVREGFAIDHPPCLCLSTSFGCHDGDKVYLSWDLSEPAASAIDVVCRGMRRLWPQAPPVYLDPRAFDAREQP